MLFEGFGEKGTGLKPAQCSRLPDRISVFQIFGRPLAAVAVYVRNDCLSGDFPEFPAQGILVKQHRFRKVLQRDFGIIMVPDVNDCRFYCFKSFVFGD